MNFFQNFNGGCEISFEMKHISINKHVILYFCFSSIYLCFQFLVFGVIVVVFFRKKLVQGFECKISIWPKKRKKNIFDSFRSFQNRKENLKMFSVCLLLFDLASVFVGFEYLLPLMKLFSMSILMKHQTGPGWARLSATNATELEITFANWEWVVVKRNEEIIFLCLSFFFFDEGHRRTHLIR